MSYKIILLLFAFSFLLSCKKANDCEKCIINIFDDSGNFVNKAETTSFTNASGNYIGKGRKSCN